MDLQMPICNLQMKTDSSQSSSRLQFANRNLQILAWQGWTLTVPATWNPVKVDGDEHEGSLLLADLHAARLGLRWKTAGRRVDSADWADRAMRGEVGKLAAAEARDYVMPDGGTWAVSRLYQDPKPPGRDVWAGHSRHSNRLLEVVHHAERRDPLFTDSVLPSLTDTPTDAAKRWAIFDLSFVTPPGTRVQWYRFNAGDLAVGLSTNKRLTVVRQIGPAGLALSRQALPLWLTQMQPVVRRLYHRIDRPESATLALPGRTLDGLRGTLHRKRRLWWLWPVAKQQTVLAFHDPVRDRLLIGQSENESALRDVLATVGWNHTQTAED